MAEEGYQTVNRLIVKPLAPLFSRVPGGNKKGFFRAVCRQLAKFDEDVLRMAEKSLAERATGSTWPNTGDLFKACTDAQAALENEAAKRAMADRQATKGGERFPLPDRAAVAIMVKAEPDLCRYAVEGGFAHLIFEYVKKHHAMPSNEDCEAFYLQAKDRLEKAQAAFDENPHKITECLLKGILGRRAMVEQLIKGQMADQPKNGGEHAKAS